MKEDGEGSPGPESGNVPPGIRGNQAGEQELDAAYRRYLSVFSHYWDPERHRPVERGDFPFYYQVALFFRDSHERDLRTGVLNPVGYYAATQWGQFLGVPVTPEELARAFRYGFAQPGSRSEVLFKEVRRDFKV